MIFKISDEKPLLLDGAVGSLLQTYGIKMHPVLWSSFANIYNSETVKKVHEDYLKAGADIISTNTFRTNPAAVEKSRLDINYRNLVEKSVNLAKDFKEQYNFILAGCNAPAEDCYQSERTLSRTKLEYNHKKHIELLWESGCDIILNETQSHFDEIEIIADFCESNDILYFMSLYFTPDLKMLSGEPISEIIEYLSEKKSELIAFNCIKYNVLTDLLGVTSPGQKWGFYLNVGKDDQTDAKIETGVFPDEYSRSIEKLFSLNPALIGACCGSTPEHITKLRELLDERYPN